MKKKREKKSQRREGDERIKERDIDRANRIASLKDEAYSVYDTDK